jgi:hypothetical protein
MMGISGLLYNKSCNNNIILVHNKNDTENISINKFHDMLAQILIFSDGERAFYLPFESETYMTEASSPSLRYL